MGEVELKLAVTPADLVVPAVFGAPDTTFSSAGSPRTTNLRMNSVPICGVCYASRGGKSLVLYR